MKFIKGAMVGSIVATGIYMLYSEKECNTRKRLLKNGKKFIKKVGII